MIKLELTQREVEAFWDAEAEFRGEVLHRDPQAIVNALAVFHREIIKNKPTQEQYVKLGELFMGSLRETMNTTISGAAQNRIYVLAAIRAGILDGVDPARLGDMRPGEIKKLAESAIRALESSYEVPGE